MNTLFQPGKLVSLRGRDWIVLPSDDKDLLVVKPLGGSDDEMTGIYLPLAIASDQPADANFPPPSPGDLGDIATARLLYESARLAFRNGAGPFRCLGQTFVPPALLSDGAADYGFAPGSGALVDCRRRRRG